MDRRCDAHARRRSGAAARCRCSTASSTAGFFIRSPCRGSPRSCSSTETSARWLSAGNFGLMTPGGISFLYLRGVALRASANPASPWPVSLRLSCGSRSNSHARICPYRLSLELDRLCGFRKSGACADLQPHGNLRPVASCGRVQCAGRLGHRIRHRRKSRRALIGVDRRAHCHCPCRAAFCPAGASATTSRIWCRPISRSSRVYPSNWMQIHAADMDQLDHISVDAAKKIAGRDRLAGSSRAFHFAGSEIRTRIAERIAKDSRITIFWSALSIGSWGRTASGLHRIAPCCSILRASANSRMIRFISCRSANTCRCGSGLRLRRA